MFDEERKLFEKWAREQFKQIITPGIFDRIGDAYAEETINAMFISFCAGSMLSKQLSK